MSLLTDLRAVSENAVEQVAARFSELPRPLLAAIGAGDMAVEQLAILRESLTDSIGERVSANAVDIGDVRSAVADLPVKAQKVAADVAAGIEQFAAEAPAKAQELIAQLPGRLAEFSSAAQSLSPDAFRETVEAYTQLVGMIYGNLAQRGDRTWSKVRSGGLRPGAVIDASGGSARSVPAHPAAQATSPAPVKATSPVPVKATGAVPVKATSPVPVKATGAVPAKVAGAAPTAGHAQPIATTAGSPKSGPAPKAPRVAAPRTPPTKVADNSGPTSAEPTAGPAKAGVKPRTATPKSAAKRADKEPGISPIIVES